MNSKKESADNTESNALNFEISTSKEEKLSSIQQHNNTFLKENLSNTVHALQETLSNEIVESNMMEVTENVEVDTYLNSNIPTPLLQTGLNENVKNNIMEASENIDVDSYSNFKILLQQYCINSNLNHVQIRGLLGILRTHQCYQKLPKDSRTLLKCKRNKLSFTTIGNGVYWHIGLVHTLREHLQFFEKLPDILKLDLNTDGLSLNKSNPYQFWPIQFRITNIVGFKPLIAGICKGPDKPSDINLFFQQLIDEYKDVKRRGGLLINKKKISIIFENFIADAPARALILNHLSHNGTEPCSKCKVSGYKYKNRTMVFPGIDFEKRNDKDYKALVYDDHQKGKKPLFKLDISPTLHTPFEIIHLVYLGLTVKHLEAWINGKYEYTAKLSKLFSEELSQRYLHLNKFCPNDFARRPRSLLKPGKLKATEFRHFLLYASSVVCEEIIPMNQLVHLRHLIIAMRIFCQNNITEEQFLIAETCLKVYVTFAPNLYTLAFVSYNVHAVQHIVDDARLCGNLEKISAFTYENNMPLFKKNIRNHPKPLQQLTNRLQEKQGIQHKMLDKSCSNYSKVSIQHTEGPIPVELTS
ncbi:hypothetical protein TKK_0011577 [Trichogramma kaykai]